MLRPIQSLSDHEAQHEQMGLARLNEGLIVDIPDLPSRPSAAVFGTGHAYIVTPTYRIKCTSDGVSWVSHGSSDSIEDRPSAAALGKGSWQVGNAIEYSDGVSWSGIGAIGRPYILAQGAVPMMVPPSSTVGANGALQLGTKVGGGTLTFGATSGTGVSATLSVAGLSGTSADVGKVITADGGKQATITAAVSTTVATVTINGTLSGTGPFTDWTLANPFLTVYSDIYINLPAGAAYSGSLAGWYYSSMSSTTVGTIYDNIYTSGVSLAIPSSPSTISSVAIGEFTQITAIQTAINFTNQGEALGNNGKLNIWIDESNNNTTTSKRTAFYIDTTEIHLQASTINVGNPHEIILQNRGTQLKQKATRSGVTSEGAFNSVSGQFFSIDTSIDHTLKITLQLSGAITDWICLEAYSFMLFHL
jgi:hypothetical protein